LGYEKKRSDIKSHAFAEMINNTNYHSQGSYKFFYELRIHVLIGTSRGPGSPQIARPVPGLLEMAPPSQRRISLFKYLSVPGVCRRKSVLTAVKFRSYSERMVTMKIYTMVKDSAEDEVKNQLRENLRITGLN